VPVERELGGHRAEQHVLDETKEKTMGLLSKLTKGAAAKKAISAAQKPENQRKIKSAISSMRGKKSGGTGTTRRG
jgi:hypothetical protein